MSTAVKVLHQVLHRYAKVLPLWLSKAVKGLGVDALNQFSHLSYGHNISKRAAPEWAMEGWRGRSQPGSPITIV